MTSHEPEVVGIDQPIRDLEAQWGISRNALKKRAAALGVELIRVSSTDTRWPATYVDLGHQLHQHLQGGGTLKDFPGSRVALTASTTATTETKAITKGVDAEALAAVVATVMAQCTSSLPAAADPLARARALAEAADNGLVLDNAELKALGVRGVADEKTDREAHGYRFVRHQPKGEGTAVMWTVERAIKQRSADGQQPSLAPEKGEKRVGFDVAALMPAVTVEAISLPYFSC